MKRLLFLAPLLTLCACNSDGTITDDDPSTKTLVTIEQGVAGRAFSVVWGPDDGLESSEPLPGVAVTIEADDGIGGLSEVATLTTDDNGFYEHALAPGDYVIRDATSGDLDSFKVPAGEIMECTFVTPSGLGPNWSCGLLTDGL